MMCKKNNIVWHNHKVNREDREKIKRHRACLLWFTGLPASGKSSIAHELEYVLNKKRIHTYVLDGDNIRHGINQDLGFTARDREENIRRIGEIARLFVDTGILTITAFISPFIKDRVKARSLLKEGEFIEIYTKCPLSICKERDPKGLYKKAMAGQIDNFTGISHPYEEPLHPEILLETGQLTIDECVNKILTYLQHNKIIK